MDLESLLDTHTVVYRCLGDESSSFHQMMSTSDLNQYLPTSAGKHATSHYLMIFKNEIPSIGSEIKLFDDRFNFSSACYVTGYTTGTLIYSQIMFQNVQTAGKVTIKLRFVLGNCVVYSSAFDLELMSVYDVCTKFSYSTAGSFLCTVKIREVDNDGVVINETVGGAVLTRTINGTLSNQTTVQTYYYENIAFDGFRYEADVSPADWFNLVPHRTFGNIGRRMDFVYYTIDPTTRQYVFPPSPAFDGSAYDRSYVLETQIDDMQTEIAILKAELSEGGTLWDSVKDLFDTVGGVFDIAEAKITHWKDILTNGEGAVKTNLVRLINNVIVQGKKGVS